MRLFEKGQGATEYLLMLAAVLVIVAIAVYYVTSTGGYPAISAVAEISDTDNIRITVTTGSIPAGDWQYSVSKTSGSYTWVDGGVKLQSPYVVIATGKSPDNYYVSLKHKPSGNVYFADQKLEITG